ATVPELFAEQARRGPGAVALEHGGGLLAHPALARRADPLPRPLAAAGVGPEVPVALCLSHASDLVVAILAVLEAGGAYVPLHPAFPPERLAFFLADTGAPVLVTTSRLLSRFPRPPAHVLCLDR